MYCEKPFLVKEAFLLQVPTEYQELFPIGETEVTVDFVFIGDEGHIIVHDILAHPAEDPIGCVKLELLRSQYPTLDIRPITPRKTSLNLVKIPKTPLLWVVKVLFLPRD